MVKIFKFSHHKVVLCIPTRLLDESYKNSFLVLASTIKIGKKPTLKPIKTLRKKQTAFRQEPQNNKEALSSTALAS